MSVRTKRKMEKRRKTWQIVLPTILLIVALGAIMVWKVFVVKEVEVVGNEIYADEKFEEWVINDEYSWNSLYVFFKNKFSKGEEIPFVDEMEVSLKSPSKIQIKVIEKGVLGYVYSQKLDQNIYFDKDGFVVEISPNVIEGTMKVEGLYIGKVQLYKKLELEDESILRTLLSLTQLLKKYDQIPNVIHVEDGDITLSYGQIQVNIGSGSSLNEKILRMDQILPQLEGQVGTVHLDTWSKSNTDIYFKQSEIVEIEDEEPIVFEKGFHLSDFSDMDGRAGRGDQDARAHSNQKNRPVPESEEESDEDLDEEDMDEEDMDEDTSDEDSSDEDEDEDSDEDSDEDEE